jgi:hypothetical protein
MDIVKGVVIEDLNKKYITEWCEVESMCDMTGVYRITLRITNCLHRGSARRSACGVPLVVSDYTS